MLRHLVLNRRWIFGVFGGLVIVAISAGAILLSRQNNIESQTADISTRLITLGVPVIRVTTITSIPYTIEVEIQSQSSTKSTAPEDNWYMMLAIRVVSYHFRTNTRVDSFTINLFNSKGSEIYTISKKINLSDPDQQVFFNKSALNNEQTRQLISSQLPIGNLTLVNLDVQSINSSGDSGQILNVKVSAKDITEANQYLPDLFKAFLRFLYVGNSQYGTYVVLGHFQLVDAHENSLLDFARENESGEELWSEAPGVWNAWHSRGPVLANPNFLPI